MSKTAQPLCTADMPNLMKKRIEEVAAVMKVMEEKKRELQQLNKEVEELEQTISMQESVIRRLSSAEPENLEMDSCEKEKDSNLEDWVKTMFDRVTAGPYQKSFSKFKDPMKQMEVIQDFLRRARAKNTDKAETSPQQH